MTRFLDWCADMPGWAVLTLLAVYIFMSVSTLPPQTRCIGFEMEAHK